MKKYIFGVIFSLIAVIAMGAMGVEIFVNNIRNLDRIKACGYVTLACLIGNLVVALARLHEEKKK